MVLSNGEVLTGKFSLEPLHDLVLFREGDERSIFPAHKIQSLNFYDYKANINRRYVSLKETNPFHNRYQLFELVVSGEVSVLRRQKTQGRRLSDALDFTYYTLCRDELLPLRKFNKQIYPLLSAAMCPLVEDFVRKNRLQPFRPDDSIRIIEFYNRCLKSTDVLAKQ
jgi:hypothetical protein